MLRDNLVGSSHRCSIGTEHSCLENPRPQGAESSLTENVTLPFQAEPAHEQLSFPRGQPKMKNLPSMVAVVFLGVCAFAAGRQNSQAGAKTMHATGSFEIQMKAQGGGTDGKTFPRFTSDKQFQGDLEGASVGEMLASGPPPSGPKGSGGYVAMERVTGKLGELGCRGPGRKLLEFQAAV